MIPQTARKFSPTFVATITAASVETKVSSAGKDYLLCAGAKFERKGHEPQTRTVMAFGQSAQDLRDLLSEGRPVDLAVQFDGGTVKVLGTPRPQQIAAMPAAPAIQNNPMPEQLLLACIEAGGYDQNERFNKAA